MPQEPVPMGMHGHDVVNPNLFVHTACPQVWMTYKHVVRLENSSVFETQCAA